MKIAIVSLSYLPISSKSIGGMEAFVYGLSSGLAKKNHEVTLFGLQESEIEGQTIGVAKASDINEEKLALDNKYFVRRYVTYQALALKEALKKASDYDVIHVNLAEWQWAFVLEDNQKNIIVTAHGNYLNKQLTKEILEKNTNPKLVGISKYAYNNFFPDYSKKSLIYNGVDTDKYLNKYTKKDYLLWLGRITPIKETHVAIEVAQKLNKKLLIAGGIDYQDYFDEKIKNHLSDQIQYLGPVFGEEKNKLLGEAEALLFTSNYPESFGMVAAEAMACGTPVVCFDKGALSEVVENGKTGFVVNNVTEMIEKVKIIKSIKPEDCRQRVVDNFSQEKMIEEYIKIY